MAGRRQKYRLCALALGTLVLFANKISNMNNYLDFTALLSLVQAQKPGLSSDSRKVGPGHVFVAAPGISADGAKFIPDAVRAGAAFIVCRREDFNPGETGFSGQVTWHDNPSEALGDLAEARYGDLIRKLEIFGITGTNGKTTCAYLLEHFFNSMGRKCGVIGTVNYRWPGHQEDAPLTTPDMLRNFEMLAAMAEAGADTAIMEVSSHALAQGRVARIAFSGVVFTNLTQDHLDYHSDMEEYFQAKSRLFIDYKLKVPVNKKLAINTDDQWGRKLRAMCPGAMSFGLEEIEGEQGLKGWLSAMSPAGLELEVSLGNSASWRIRSPLVGAYNASNLLAVQAVALNCGYAPEDMRHFEDFHGVPGRLERIGNGNGLNIFVDYAHTPDALINVQKALRGAGFKRLITVFGCGGNRDRKKRPLMGEAVAEWSDVAVLTSDNPRHEDPGAIIDDVLPGLGKAGELFVEPDRRKATAMAMAMLGPEDALLVAGKGHESYQQIGAVKYPYSDQQTIKELMCVQA